MTTRLTDEELAGIDRGSTWIDGVGGPDSIARRLVAEVRALRAEVVCLADALREVWESVPATYEPTDPRVRRHAAALNAAGAIVERRLRARRQ
jgi:hypothetical protein